MTEKKTDQNKIHNITDDLLHHPTYFDCSYEKIVPQKFMGPYFFRKFLLKKQSF